MLVEVLTTKQRWYLRNRDRLNERAKARYHANKAEISAQAKARYQKDPERVKARGARWRKERRDVVNNCKNKPCADCGQKFPLVCMDFDHRGDDTKVDCVATMVARGVAMETILAEIAKCDVVCSNCHRIRTATRAGRLE